MRTGKEKGKKKRVFSEEHKRNMRGPRPQISGENNPFFGKIHTKESRKKIGDKKHWNDTRRRKIAENHMDVSGEKNPNYGNHKPQSKESNRKRSETLMNRLFSEDHKRKIGEGNKGKICSEETKEELRQIGRLRWKDPEFQKKMKKAWNIKPNKPETSLLNLLNNLYPNEWKYVGDFQFWLGGKNPDFMNVNGHKKLIELYGDYWHSKEVTGEDEKEHEQDRIDYFKQYGFDTLIIWESELEDLDLICGKIDRFVK